MVVKPVVQGMGIQSSSKSQVNVAAIFVFVVLMILSRLIVIPLTIGGVHWGWISGHDEPGRSDGHNRDSGHGARYDSGGGERGGLAG